MPTSCETDAAVAVRSEMGMEHDANAAGVGWRALDALVSELGDAHRAVAEAQARVSRLFAAALDLALERAAQQQADGIRRRADSDLPVREVAAEIAAALRLSDRSVQRRMGDAFTTATDYARTQDAWERGAIDAAHVSAILDGGVGIDPTLRETYERYALAAAETETAGRMRSIARIIAARVDPESSARRRAQAKADRGVRVIDLPDGMARLLAELPAPLAYAIHDRLTRMAKRVHEDPPPVTVEELSRTNTADSVPGELTDPASVDETLDPAGGPVVVTGPGPHGTETAADRPEPDLAGTAVAVDAAACVGTAAAGTTPPVDTRTMDQTRADLLTDLLLAATPVAHGVGLDAITGHVQVTVPVLTLAGVGSQPALLVGHGPVDADVARRLAANAPGWDRVMTDPYTGAVLAVDRYRQSADLERYLRARDERCRCPGCRRLARRSDVDHTVDAARGGPTTSTNLAHLCRRHHTLKHETAWRVRQLAGGVLEWTGPTGRTYVDRPPGIVTFVPDETPPPF